MAHTHPAPISDTGPGRNLDYTLHHRLTLWTNDEAKRWAIRIPEQSNAEFLEFCCTRLAEIELCDL